MAVIVMGTALPVAAQDTLVVEADNPPVWGDAPTLVEELRIGTVEGDPDTSFGLIAGIEVDSAGVIWVADTQGPALRRFSPEGSFLGYVGRAGEGPGEFQGLAGIRRLGDDRMATWDAHAGRFSVFDLSGRFLSSATHYVGVLYAPDVFVVDRADHFLIRTMRFDAGADRSAPRRSVWLRIDEDGVLQDSVQVPPHGRTVLGGRDYPFGYMPPFESIMISAMGPDGVLVYANTGQYALQRRLGDGRIIEIRRPWDAVPVDPGEREQYRALARHVATLWGPQYTDDVPSMKPPIWALRVDADGRYWVATHSPGYYVPETDAERERRRELIEYRGSEPPPFEWWEPLVVDVIDPRGQFLGAIRLPNNRIRLGEARGMHVWAIESGEFGEEYVVRYRIEPSR